MLIEKTKWMPKITRSTSNPLQVPSTAIADVTRNTIRKLIVDDVEKGKETASKVVIDEVNRLIDGKPVGCFTAAAQRFADSVAKSSIVQADEMLDLISLGAAGAIWQLAKRRKAMAEQFAATSYSKRLREFEEQFKAASDEYAALQAEQNVFVHPAKIERARQTQDALNYEVNRMLNSQDPELLQHRQQMKATSQLNLNELDWKAFLI